MRRFGSVPGLVAAAGASVLLAATPAAPVSPSFWRSDTYEAFEGGTPAGTSILSDGRIVLSPPFEERDIPESQYVWGAVFGAGGAVYVAAGTPGRVYRLGRGEPEVLLELETADVPAIASGWGGDVFVGTAPGGEVYRLGEDGSFALFFETEQGGVWSMAYSEEHGLLVGTGDSARVYAVDGDGAGGVVYESDESSIASLAVVGDRVIAGTGTGGLVVDVTPGRDVRVLYDADVDEISGIAAGPDGEIYFAASSVALDDALDEDAFGGEEYGDGYVFRTAGAGGAVGLSSFEGVPIASLGAGPDGSVWVGAGVGGRIYSVGALGLTDLVADLEPEQVLSIVPARDGVLVATAGPGSVFFVGEGAADSGSYESEAFDAAAVSTWGELAWRTEEPAGSRVSFSTRSGNTADPDDSWGEWTPVSGDGEGPIESAEARFIQWRAELASGRGAVPSVRYTELNYVEANLPPRMNEITVYGASDVSTEQSSEGSLEQTLPSGVRVTYSAGEDEGGPETPARPLGGIRTVEWDAFDPNGDSLDFDVWITSEDADDWKLLDEDVERTLHTWDTQSMPDGLYRVKVVASDRPSNPLGSELTDERVGAPFTVDNTPPEVSVSVSREGDALVVAGGARDALSAITRVEVAVDYGDWKPAFAADGIFDSRSESFEVDVEDPGAGEHMLSVRAFDRAGNASVSRVVHQ